MALRKSKLRLRAEKGAGKLGADDVGTSDGPGSALGAAVKLILTGSTAGRWDKPGELDDLPLPDLLWPSVGEELDAAALMNYIDLAFLGRASAGELDRHLEEMSAGSTRWTSGHFANDLFLAELVRDCMRVEVRGLRLTAHRRFLCRVLANPPTDVESIRYRQGILRELEERREMAEAFEALILEVGALLELLRASRDDARLSPVRFRLDVLGAFRKVVLRMDGGFEGAASGLARLASMGETVLASRAFRNMEDLLDHQERMATLQLGAVIGADGRLRHLEIQGLKELTGNRYFRRPLRRWWTRLRMVYRRYRIPADEMVDRLVMNVYQEVAPALARAVQLLSHLEIFQAARSFAAESRSRGLEVSLPRVREGAQLRLEALFNPLLTTLTHRPVCSDVVMDSASPITLVTGPNSGGKTRLLQAIGIAQVLGQSGFYVPCARAEQPLVADLFASIIEVDRADQSEGRLGTELMRLRTLFETVPRNSLVLLDELCSGTNPSEAIEIVEMVLRLLDKIEPVAFVTTHFLDFAHRLSEARSTDGLGFLQAEVDDERGATYRFIEGVATTSLAVGTARRLGVTFEELEQRLECRRRESRESAESERK